VRRLGATLAVLLFSATITAQSLPQLFHKAKAQVKGEAWQDALGTLDRLDAESAKPGNETARRQLEAAMAFYRGVCEANLDMAEKAQSDFETFLALQPNATMDPSMYSKKAIAAFRAARKAAPPSADADGSDKQHAMFRAFQEFRMPPNAAEPLGETWADGPIQWIMSEEEKRAWRSLVYADERQEFIERFWENRNPRPGNADNSYKNAFERRVAFADARFVIAEGTRGSMTDRGMVFVLLGPPSVVGKRPLRAGEDVDVSRGMSMVGSRGQAYAQRVMAAAGDASSASGTAASETLFGPGINAPDSSGSWKEVWHYRKELLPKTLRYQQVRIEFVTRKDLGVGVFQRDPAAVASLEAARGRFTNP
jgi:GWxTD domain-containing protein